MSRNFDPSKVDTLPAKADTPALPFKDPPIRLKPPRAPRTATAKVDADGVPVVAATEAVGSVKLTPGQAWVVRQLVQERITPAEAESYCKRRWQGKLIGGELKAVLKGYAAAMDAYWASR
jgi:hypothetical protein